MPRKFAVLLLAASFAVAPAAFASSAAHFAAKNEKPDKGNSGHDKGNHGNNDYSDRGQKADDKPGKGNENARDQNEDRRDWRFRPSDRDLVAEFYRNEYQAGRCPPGLAKKNNGCLPPGQAKKMWARGEYLPADYTYYDLPGDLYGRLEAPPYGYSYVTVDGDVLLIQLASRLIIDLIQPGY